MDRRPQLPATDPDRPIRGDSDIFSQVNAVFKRHRPLGAMQNFPRASRVLVPQEEPLKSTGSIASAAGRKLPKTVANRRAGRLLAVGSDQEKDSVVEIKTTPAEDSLLNPPSVTRSVTDDQNNNIDRLGMEQGDAELLLDQKKASLACPLSCANFKKDQFSSAENSGLTFQSKQVLFSSSKFNKLI